MYEALGGVYAGVGASVGLRRDDEEALVQGAIGRQIGAVKICRKNMMKKDGGSEER